MEQVLAYRRHLISGGGTLLAVLAIVIAIELIMPSRRRYSLKDRGLAVVITLLGFSIGGALVLPLQILWAKLGLHPLFALRFDQWFGWAGIGAGALATFVGAIVTDFFGYWFHRIQHGPLWRFHAVHHSVEELHGLKGYTHLFDPVFQYVIMTIPMSFLPVTAAPAGAVMMLLMILQPYYIHSPMNPHFGVLRRVFTDNRYHRIHHSTDPAHFDKNFGTMTTIWDQVFGTAYFPKTDEWPDTGLADMREPRSVAEWLVAPFRFRGRLQAAQA